MTPIAFAVSLTASDAAQALSLDCEQTTVR
jgi:hypothetical protein